MLLAALQIRHFIDRISLRVRLYSAHAPITGSSRELGSTPRGGFPLVAREPVGQYSGNVYAPQEGMSAV